MEKVLTKPIITMGNTRAAENRLTSRDMGVPNLSYASHTWYQQTKKLLGHAQAERDLLAWSQ